MTHQENKWKVTQVLPPQTPNHGLPIIVDEYNLCNLLGYNGKYPWHIVHNTVDCYQTFWIDKDTKRIVQEFNEDLNLREISAPANGVKKLQGRLAGLIFNKLPKHPCNFAYMSGKNVRHAAEHQVDGDVLIRIDMKDFFTHHYEPYVRSKLHELTGYSKELCWFITKLCSLRGSLPQGAVTSPVLSVVLNYDMDVRISEIARAHNLVYTRYADDLCFSGVDRDDTYLHQFIEEVAEAAHPFRVNWKKVEIMRNRAKSFVCGVEVRNFEDALPEAEIEGYTKKATQTKITITRTSPVTATELEELVETVKYLYGNDVAIRPKRFYMQSIKRMLGMHLTDGINYPREKYKRMRLEAMLVAKGAENVDVPRFRGRLAFMRLVDPDKAAKIDAILNKHRRDA